MSDVVVVVAPLLASPVAVVAAADAAATPVVPDKQKSAETKLSEKVIDEEAQAGDFWGPQRVCGLQAANMMIKLD